MPALARLAAPAAAIAMAASLLALAVLTRPGAQPASAVDGDAARVSITKDEIVGDGLPASDLVQAGVPAVRTVAVETSGPGDLTLSIAGPAGCDPRWVKPVDPLPSNVGGLQFSIVTISGLNTGILTADYSVECPASASHNVQIVANYDSLLPDEDLTNNQDENTVQVLGPDPDSDGFTTARERFLGTSPSAACAASPAADDEQPDSYPSDFNDDQRVDLADLSSFGPSYNSAAPAPAYNQRHDLNASGAVSLPDVLMLGPAYNTACQP
jgi:hypothetical protein